MNKAKFLDKYDKDFVNIMIEIQNRIENFSKINKLKINSWAKSLCLPTNNIAWKKNRNLYAIKLLDNILNGKLEKPFTKYAEDGEKLPKLDPILVKSQLTNKVNEVISNGHPELQIQNFINSNYEIAEPNLYDNYDTNFSNIQPNSMLVNRAKTPVRARINKNKFFNNSKYKDIKTEGDRENIYSFNYDNLEGMNNFNNYSYPVDMNNNNAEEFYRGDELLKKNYFNFNQKLSNEPGFYRKTNPNNISSEKSKLQSTILFLENEAKIKNQIINKQDMDIQQLKKRISELEKKIKMVFSK